jgi:hypothetical protein
VDIFTLYTTKIIIYFSPRKQFTKKRIKKSNKASSGLLTR